MVISWTFIYGIRIVARVPEFALDSNPLIDLLDKNPITQKRPSEISITLA
jgi:hypothetical protein